MNARRARVTELPDAGTRAFLSPCRWTAAPHDRLAAVGYAVREFLVATTVDLYVDAAHGADVRPVGALDVVTRSLVIAPEVRDGFRGRVHVELLNPSTGADFPMYWPDAAAHLIRRGDAYVGVTCKSVTAATLARIDPQRYGAVAIAHDGAVWDLLGTVGATLRRPDGGGLLPGLGTAHTLLATGWSQSGSFLRTFLRQGLHARHSARVGQAVFDAYLIGVSSGGFGPMGYIPVDRDGEFAFDADLRPRDDLHIPAMDDPRRTLRSAPVPTIEYMSEDECVQHVWHQRPDSDVPGDVSRLYQVPGRGHETGLLDERDRAADYAVLGEPVDLTEAPPRHPASRHTLAATIEHLFGWVQGTSPARHDPIAVDVDPGAPRDPAGLDTRMVRVLRDDDGHALGGLRHLDVDLPLGRAAVDPDGPATIRRWVHVPFTPEELARRYGSARQFAVLAAACADRLVAAGALLAEDRDTALAEHVARAVFP